MHRVISLTVAPEGSKECPVCYRQFINDSAMKKHLKCHGKSYGFRCNGCGKVPSGFRAHIQTHADSVDKFSCNTWCNSIFQRRCWDFLLSHTIIISCKDGEQKCQHHGCSKRFTNPHSKQNHVAYCPHDPDKKGHFKCLFQVVIRSILVQRTRVFI